MGTQTVEESSSSSIEYDEATVKQIKWKVDARLCVVVAIMYTVCQIDRTNLANALTTLDLHQSTMVVTFFPFYTLFQPPMTVIARKVGPRMFLGGLTVAWGLVMVGFGLINDWKALVGLRCALGLLEAGFFPSCVFLIGTWYVRHETAKRLALFYLLGSALSGFGGILAYGLQQMDGVDGKAGWRWIFIMEGILTVLVGLIGFIFIVDFPEDARRTRWFLTDREIDIMIDRVEKDRGDAHVTPFKLNDYLKNVYDWKGWLFTLNFAMTAVVIYAVAYFLPIVLREGLGFSVAMSQTLTAPCYIFGAILGFAESWLSDKYKSRGPIIIFNSLLEIVGVAVLGFAESNSVRFFGAFILVGSCTANLPASLTYQSNNITGQWRRAFGSALIVGAGGVGGVIGSLVFRNQDKPHYRPGLCTCLIAAGLTIVSVCITTISMARKNVRQRQNELAIEGTPGFRYTL
ncbi:major facilitator superfamily domain-containing protein [Aspergillus ambiguus]|uniref:major facilitator superfamily domain-containing protein n=1 Tax=Aspergillus ambiguus TaxID=176160 RepID=UPI003CCCF5F2